ncbi:MAG: hypothetical protein EBQ95_01915 [Gammaproteobacteria bacterium]|nr:hypothetical protein [Gammaproteobacteria bacterium]
MKLTEIKALAATIEYEEQYEEMNISDLIFSEYSQKLRRKFDELFRKMRPKNYLIQQFIEMCKVNWDLVKGTALCYTAEPNCIETRLFVKMAEYLSQNDRDKKSAFEYLMPGVTYEFARDGYPDLRTIELSIVLQTHILGDNDLYLVPIKLLTEINLSPTQGRLDNPYFDETHHAMENWKISKNEMERLFLHSNLTEDLKKAKDAVENIANQDTHLLGQLRYLCKNLRLGSILGEGSEEDATIDAYQAMIHFMDYFNQLFSRRLISLSSLPADLSKYKEQVLWVGRQSLFEVAQNGELKELPISNMDTFKARLKALKQANPSEKRNMRLTVLEWDSLCQDIIEYSPIDPRISPGLKHEILYLFRMTSSQELNIVSHEDTESCIMKRREALVASVLMQEDVLAEIRLDNEIAHDDLETQRQQFFPKREAILTALENEEYEGLDNLNHYSVLLERLELDYEIFMVEQLKFIDDFPVEEIREIFVENPKFVHETTALFRHINDFVFQLLTWPADKIILMITLLKSKLQNEMIKSLDDLINLVKTLDAECCGEVIRLFALDYIQDWDDLLTIGRGLELAHFRLACSQLKPFIIAGLTAQRFHDLSIALDSEEIMNTFHEVIFGELPSIVHNIDDYFFVKALLKEQHDQIFFEQMHPQMKAKLISASDYGKYFQCLFQRQKSVVFQELVEDTPNIIHTLKDLKDLLPYLGRTFFNEYCLVFGERIVSYLTTSADIYELVSTLQTRQCEMFARILEEHLHITILESPYHTNLAQMEGFFQNLYELKAFTLHVASICSQKHARKLTHYLIYRDEEGLLMHLQRMVNFRPKQRFFSAEPVIEQLFCAISQLSEHWRQVCFRTLKTNDACTLQDFSIIIAGRHEGEPATKKLKSERHHLGANL